MASSISVQSVIDYASTHAELLPLSNVGGYSNQPALTLVQDTLAEFLAPPYPWKFNRKKIKTFTTRYGAQSYLYAGASVWTQKAASLGYGTGACIALAPTGITESGFTVTVTTLEAHQFSVGDSILMTGNTVGAYNSTFTQTATSSSWSGGWTVTAVPSATSFQFAHAQSGLGASGAPGILDLGWIENASMVDMLDSQTIPYIWTLEGCRTLQETSVVLRPEKVCVYSDDGAGVVTIRLDHPTSGTLYGLTINYQAKAPVPTDLKGFWTPIPDELAFAYRQLFLAKCYRYLNSKNADGEYMKAEKTLAKALAEKDTEQSEEYIVPRTGLMGPRLWL